MSMVKYPFNGQLNSNEIFSAIYNMIISQEVFADNIAGVGTLAEKAKVDGGLYGDTKLYYATDVLKSVAWGKDAEAANLLALHRPADPKCQAIVLDQFRQIALTVDNYLTKRAWSDEGTFGSFNSIMLGWIGETKRIYENMLYNVFIGTTETSEGAQSQTVVLGSDAEVRAKKIAEKVANILVDMKDVSRDFNDLGYLRSYKESEIKFIWNSKYVNEVRKIDLPEIFHKDGLMDKFAEDILPARFFGVAITAADAEEGGAIAGNKVAEGAKVRSKVEKDYVVGGVAKHAFPGDLIAVNTTVGGSSASFLYAETYLEDETVICKILVKYPPLMSAFEVGTSFFNPKSLTENHYLTWGYNTLDYLKNYPFITLKEVDA